MEEIRDDEDKVLDDEEIVAEETPESGLDIVDIDETPAVEEVPVADEADETPVEEGSDNAEDGEPVETGHAELDRPVYDVPPPDLSQVGSRLDTEERWYVLHTFNGYEAVAEDNLKKVVEKYNLDDRIKEIFIPTEDVVTEKRGKKVLVPTRTMPSYIFVKMIYGDDLWHTVTRTRGITGFVGPKGRPLPLSSKEVVEMKLERKANLVNTKISEGDLIQVVDGPLAGQTGTVISVDAASKKCTVSVTMFSKPTQVELAFSQIKAL
ncbi:MAG: transcription termination/antitermination protein NusG [Firmicutes bacterium]|nr:transcription termination/antitermination protein NusG [Bacillota bacterium]